MTVPLGLDWPARCVLILVVLWKSVLLVRAFQARRPPDIWRQGAYALGFAALLVADLSLLRHPALPAPWHRPGVPADWQSLGRWPGVLFFAALLSVVAALAGAREKIKGALRAKVSAFAILSLVSLLLFVDVTRFRGAVLFTSPQTVVIRGRRHTFDTLNIVGLGPDIALARLDSWHGSDGETYRLLCFFWERRPMISSRFAAAGVSQG